MLHTALLLHCKALQSFCGWSPLWNLFLLSYATYVHVHTVWKHAERNTEGYLLILFPEVS